MHISKFTIENYKCFWRSPELTLSPGVTIICGRNNAGKSALIEAISLRVSHKPHKSTSSLPAERTALQPHAKGSVTIALSGRELRELLARRRENFTIAAPMAPRHDKGTADEMLEHLFASEKLEVRARFVSEANRLDATPFDGDYLGVYRRKDAKVKFEFQTDSDGTPQFMRAVSQNNPLTRVETLVAEECFGTTYRFVPERFHVGRAPHGSSRHLQPNARNLPEVLDVLSANPLAFRAYSELVRRVLPAIEQVVVRPEKNNTNAVYVRGRGVSERRLDDLAIPLDDCGTGVSQVLAMLYVVSVDQTPKTILIDEPSSFLHPGAVTELLRVFAEHPQHQYIVATHSPAIISQAEPGRIYLLSSDGNQSAPRELDGKEVEAQRVILCDVGASLADIFGPSQILWVEGPSEARSFPAIMSAFDIAFSGGQVLPVVSVGDFDRKRGPKLTAEIYERLTEGVGLIPPAIGFFFDREQRTGEDCARLSGNCPGKLGFTKRRMFESYLLHREAIAAWLSEQAGVATASDDVNSWIVEQWEIGRKRKFGAKADPRKDEAAWLAQVDAATLISSFANERSSGAHQYDKARDAPWITRWLLAHHRHALRPLADELKQFLAN